MTERLMFAAAHAILGVAIGLLVLALAEGATLAMGDHAVMNAAALPWWLLATALIGALSSLLTRPDTRPDR